MKKLGKVLLWIFFLPIMLTVTVIKSKKMGKLKKIIILVAFWLFILVGLVLDDTDESTSPDSADNITNQVDDNDEEKNESDTWYGDVISESLAKEIELAMEEIDFETVTGIRLEETRETDLFTKRTYVLDTTGFSYYAYSREWYEGEPEHEEYPNEYLTAIGGEGLGNIYWSVDGDGSEQFRKFSDTIKD